MARLQDFSDVTPSSSSDKLLIVQSAGQGLATLDTAGQQIANNTRVSQLHTTSKTLVGAVNEVNGKIKTYNWSSTNVAITTLYSGGNMYYCDVTFPTKEATDCNEILALTMVDYGGLSNVLQFQIRGSRAFRIWSKTSMTLSALTVKVLYSK